MFIALLTTSPTPSLSVLCVFTTRVYIMSRAAVSHAQATAK